MNMTVEQYIQQLSNKERAAYLIAVKILGSSFDIEKSIGYIKMNTLHP